MAKRRKWLKKTPWRRGLEMVHSDDSLLTEKELVFSLLVWCGLPRPYAFAIAFPESKANDKSAIQMSSTLMQSWRIRGLFNELAKKEEFIEFRFPKDIEDIKHPYGV